MKQAYILTEVSCQTCGMHLTVKPVVAENLEIVKKGAADIHREHNKASICAKPLLIEVYLPCIVSNEIFKPDTAPLVVTGMPASATNN